MTRFEGELLFSRVIAVQRTTENLLFLNETVSEDDFTNENDGFIFLLHSFSQSVFWAFSR